MKNLFTVFSLLLTTVIFSQTDTTKAKPKFSPYASVGISITNSNNFKMSSYPSIEVGLMRQNVSYSVVAGRELLDGLGSNSDRIQHYFYEGKVTGSFPMGVLNGNVIFGIGQLINTPNFFIEYGAGVSLTQGKFGYGLTYSNWNGTNYITPSITFNF